MVVPSLKVTVPGGIPLVELTVAVNVTDWPKLEGSGVELRLVVVADFVNAELFNITATLMPL
jgi:hypothetical protein